MTNFTEECKLNIRTKYLLEDVLGGYSIITNEDGLVDVGYHYSKVTLVNSKENDKYSIELHVSAATKGANVTIVHNGNWDTKSAFMCSRALVHEQDITEVSNMLYREIIRGGKIPTTIARITVGLYHWMLTGETKDPENNYLPLAVHVDDEDTNVLRIANRLHVNTNGARITSLMEEDTEKDFFSFSIDKEFKVFKVSNAYGDVVDSRLFDDISELEGIVTNNQALYKFIMGAYHDFYEMTPEVFDVSYSVKPLEDDDEDEEMDLSPEKSPYPNLDEIIGNWTMELDDLGYNEKQASYKLVNSLTDECLLVTFNHNVNHIAVEVSKPDGEEPYSHQIDTRSSEYGKGNSAESGSAIINSVDIRYRNLFAAIYLAEQYRKQTNMEIPLIVKPEHNGVILANSVAAFYSVICLDKDTDNALPLFFCNFELEFFGPCDADGAFRHMTSIEGSLSDIQGVYVKDSIGFIKYLRSIKDIYRDSGNEGITKKYNHMVNKGFSAICKQIVSQYSKEGSKPSAKSALQTALSNIFNSINAEKAANIQGSAIEPKSVVRFIGIADAKDLINPTNQITSNLSDTIELTAKKPEENKSFFEMASHYKFEKTADGDVTISITLPLLQAEQLEEFIKH